MFAHMNQFTILKSTLFLRNRNSGSKIHGNYRAQNSIQGTSCLWKGTINRSRDTRINTLKSINMKSTSSAEHEHGESSNATVEIRVRTLDSQTYTLKVNKQVPVPALKEQIAIVTGVVSEQQRLICRGRVLKDDQLLSAYHVEDGHTLHLVVRQPFQQSSSEADARSDSSNATHTRRPRVVVGTVNLNDRADMGIPDLNRMVSALFSNFVPGGSTAENRATMFSTAFPSENQQGSNSQAQGGSVPGISRSDINQPASDRLSDTQQDSGHGFFRFPAASFLRPIQQALEISDSLTTMSQYINRMRTEFTSTGMTSEPLGDGSRVSDPSRSNSTSLRGRLPSPAALATLLQSAQQLLTQQTIPSLNHLATQLETDASITERVARNDVQSDAMRNGMMMQFLGALFLELGRTVMTLRTGESSAESVVNAGPAVFISNSGPNPLMVQPLPFVTGSSFDAISVGAANQATRTHEANASTEANERNRQRDHANTNPIGERSAEAHGGSARRSISSIFGETGAVRVVPIRTVVAAIPAGLSAHASSEPSGSFSGVPPFARLRDLIPVQLSQLRNQNRTEETNNQQQSSSAFPVNQDQTQQNSSMQSTTENPGDQEESHFIDFFSSALRNSGSENTNVRSYVIEVGAHMLPMEGNDGSGGISGTENNSTTESPSGLGQMLSNVLFGRQDSNSRVHTDFMSELQNTSRDNITGQSTEQSSEVDPERNSVAEEARQNSSPRCHLQAPIPVESLQGRNINQTTEPLSQNYVTTDAESQLGTSNENQNAVETDRRPENSEEGETICNADGNRPPKRQKRD